MRNLPNRFRALVLVAAALVLPSCANDASDQTVSDPTVTTDPAGSFPTLPDLPSAPALPADPSSTAWRMDCDDETVAEIGTDVVVTGYSSDAVTLSPAEDSPLSSAASVFVPDEGQTADEAFALLGKQEQVNGHAYVIGTSDYVDLETRPTGQSSSLVMVSDPADGEQLSIVNQLANHPFGDDPFTITQGELDAIVDPLNVVEVLDSDGGSTVITYAIRQPNAPEVLVLAREEMGTPANPTEVAFSITRKNRPEQVVCSFMDLNIPDTGSNPGGGSGQNTDTITASGPNFQPNIFRTLV